MSTVGERLIAMMELKGITYLELSKVTGFSKSALQRYGTGEVSSMPYKKMEAIATALGVSPAQLLGWESESGHIAIEARKVPIIDTLYASRGGKVYKFFDGEMILIEPTAIGEYYYYKVSDDSMSPTLKAGDIALIRVQKETADNEYALIMLNGEQANIRRVERYNRMILLLTDNPAYPPQVLAESRMSRLITFGRVVGSIRSFE